MTTSPARNPSTEPGATPRRTNASPVLIPTRRRSGAPPTASSSSGVLGDPKTGAHGALGVVLVNGRNAEDSEDRVADELLHDSSVGLDVRAGHRSVGGEHLVDVFWISGLRGGGEPDQVAEQRGDHLAFLRDRVGRALRGVAHSLQNFAPAGFSAPQEGQVSTADAIPLDEGWTPGRRRRHHVQSRDPREDLEHVRATPESLGVSWLSCSTRTQPGPSSPGTA